VRKKRGAAMKILITGATGLVGSALTGELAQAGHTVCRLVRPETKSEATRDASGFDVKWNPLTGELDALAVGADAVVNLAGASIAQGRWTAQRKCELRGSRVDSTRALVHALATMALRPRVLISASAIGIYGDRGDEVLTEESRLGRDFLSEVAAAWEAEAEKAEALGIRVVQTRFGLILARQGGALAKMARPFRMGVGGKLGSGQQWVSWISLEDVVAILRLALENGAVRGPINVVSPQPVRNSEFTAALAKALHRPAVLPAPAMALRLMLGAMADALLLASQRVIPEQLEKLGYKHLNTSLAKKLVSLLS
jgi:uncharacterized protein